MKHSKTSIFLILVTVIMQNVIVVHTGYQDFNYTFAFGLPLAKNIKSFLPLCNMILPVFIFSFMVSDMSEQLIHGYGKLLLVRNFSKRNLLNISIIRSCILLLIIIIFQIFLYSIHHTGLKDVSFNIVFKAFFIYYLVNVCLIELEHLMGMLFGMQLGSLISIVYIFISSCMGYLNQSLIIKISCFPCLMFGILNGTLNENMYGSSSYSISIVIIACIFSGIYMINAIILKNKDIF